MNLGSFIYIHIYDEQNTYQSMLGSGCMIAKSVSPVGFGW
jgi:hypothetical protein